MINGLRVLVWPVLLSCLSPVRLQSPTSGCGARTPSGEVTRISLQCWAAARGKPLLRGGGGGLLQTGQPGLDGIVLSDPSVSKQLGLCLLSCSGESRWSNYWVTSNDGSSLSGVAWPSGAV